MANFSLSKERRRFISLSVYPVLVTILVLGFAPITYMFIISLQKFDLTDPPAVFVGFANYIELLFNDPRHIHALVFSVGFALGASIVELMLGFLIAYLLADKEISRLYSWAVRTSILIPFVATTIAVTYVFKTLVYDPTWGYLNYFLKLLGLPGFNIYRGWISPIAGLFAMELMLRTPFMVIVMYAGITSISPSILDAAQIDGASWFKQITQVIIPIMGPLIAIAFSLRFMDAMKIFDEIFVLTGGGPGFLTENLSIFAVTHAFDFYRIGYASASAFIYLILVMVLVSVSLRVAKLE